MNNVYKNNRLQKSLSNKYVVEAFQASLKIAEKYWIQLEK